MLAYPDTFNYEYVFMKILNLNTGKKDKIV